MELFDLFNYTLGIRALIASILVGLMCGVLGCFIVLRNMSLVGDALAHAVLPGVVVGFVVGGAGVMAIFTGAVVAGLITAALITWIQHNVKTKNDAAIGIVFTAMFSIGVMWISKVAREGAHLDLDHFLFGNVLGLSDSDLYLTAGITVYVLLSVVLFYRYLFATTFQPVIAETMGVSVQAVHYYLMLLLSFAVVASMQAVGVILVVAMLITPASTALLLANRLKYMLFISAGIGVAASVIGLIITDFYNTTPGPAMAVTATFFYALAVFFAPQKGLLFKFLYKRKTRKRIQFEDTLKQTLKLHERSSLSLPNLQERLGFTTNTLKYNLNLLRQKGLISRRKNALAITPEGIKQATRLVRAHRLWETYLVQEMSMDAGQIHDEAEKFEHVLTDELMDEIEANLSYPKLDPHGAPIPQNDYQPEKSLSSLALNTIGEVAENQLNNYLVTRLWQLGIGHDESFKVMSKTEDFMEIAIDNQLVKVPMTLAAKVNIEG